MISKNDRLTEREVKKVLRKGKPFFASWVVMNFAKNNLEHSRFALVLWGKSVKNAVHRNFFRRRFYDRAAAYIDNKKNCDYVFVVKKQLKLDAKNKQSIDNFYNDIDFLLRKI